MRRGCISLGDIQCDDCHRTVEYLESYLVTEEAEGTTVHLCFDCAAKKGYVYHKQEKKEQITTFFPGGGLDINPGHDASEASIGLDTQTE